MLPTISFLGFDIPTYTIMAVLGLTAAALLVRHRCRGNEQISSVQIVNIPAVSALGVFSGAHILYGITNLNKFWLCICNLQTVFASWDSFWFYFADIFGGMVFYGGLIGGIIAGYIYCRCLKLDIPVYSDVLTPAIPLFHSFGRIGCFLGGCCYGIESSWGFLYEHSLVPEADGVTRLPIQLIESAGDLFIVAVLIILSKRIHKTGLLFPIYLLMYGILRMTTEFFRGDEIRGFLLGISTSQWISAFVIIAAIAALVKAVHPRKVNIA